VRIAAFTGHSGSGKTTAIASLIAHFVAAGESVGAIKHTHHPVNEEDRGNTATFRRAGAEPVILAGDGEAVLFKGDSRTRFTFRDPRELLAHFRDHDVVLIEGFKTLDVWPRIELESSRRQTTDELLAILDRIWRS
jgi:molybdopterin-guanine dinucleotide biosynthesis protein MobB